MLSQFVVGVAITLAILIFDRKMLEIKLDKVAKFLTFMTIITAARLVVHSMAKSTPNPGLMQVEFWQFALVWWEDAYYVAPLLYLDHWRQHAKLKYVWMALMAISSIHFGLGHAYQGTVAIFITALYPYLASYKYSKRTSLGTVMVCHVLYDMITYMTSKLGYLVN